VLEVDIGAVRPQPLSQLLARDHVSGTLEHQAQDLERLVLQADAGLAVAQLAQADVELEHAEPKGRGGLRGFHKGPALLCRNRQPFESPISGVGHTIGFMSPTFHLRSPPGH
jgi:hypothetical protein